MRVAAGVGLCAVLGLGVAACVDRGDDRNDGPADGTTFDFASLVWEPEALGRALPSLIGWRQSAGEQGAIVALDPGKPATVVWQPPDEEGVRIQIEEVDPAGPQMVGIGSIGVPDGRNDSELLFRRDGSVEVLALPEGYEGVADVAFMGTDVLVVAYHAGQDAFTTALGAVDAGGEWHDVVLEGDLPEYQFIESLAVMPGSDVVGVVLKTAGGTGNRDDDALVLARRTGFAMRVISGVYRDDSLAGCVPLRGVQGVAFGRTWSDAGADGSVYVTAEWTGSEWVEQVLAPSDVAPVPVEMGSVIAEDPSGGFLVRRATGDGEGATSEMLRLRGDGVPADVVGIDLTDIVWFAWLE